MRLQSVFSAAVFSLTVCLTVIFAAISLPAGICQAESLPWIRISRELSPDSDARFVAGEENTATQFHPMGFNYDHDVEGRLLEDYWHTEWDRVEDDFRNMKALGASVVRIHLQFGKFMVSAVDADPRQLERLERLLNLAEETRLYLDLTGLGCYHKMDVPVWYDQLEESARWDAQAAFWRHISRTCRNSPAVFCYNLMNEPVIGGEKPASDWLGPAFGGKHFVQFVARSIGGRSRPEVARQWIGRMVEAVRDNDSRHLITVGFVDWSLDRPGLTSGFVPQKVADELDFIAVHLYPKSGEIDDAIETLKGFQIGKPVVVEETFPLKCSIEEMSEFMNRSESLSQGWISFFWGKMPEEYNPAASIAEAVTSQWLKVFSAHTASRNEPTAEKGNSGEKDSAALVAHFAEHSRNHADGLAAFSVNLSAWTSAGDEDTSELPIGVFDSGIGGLTVQEAVFALDAFHNDTLAPGSDGRPDFESERFIYLADQANMPYGHYPTAGKQNFLKELILKDAAFLLGRRYWSDASADSPSFDKPPVKALVIACNTATAWGLEEIRQLVKDWQIPVFVVGVVEAGARGVTESIKRDGTIGAVAVMATVGTCESNAYPRAIGRTAGLAGKSVPQVVQQGSIGLAGAIEGDPGFLADPEKNATYLGPAFGNPRADLGLTDWNTFGFEPSGLLGDPQNPASVRLNSMENYVRYDVAAVMNSHRASGSTLPIQTVVLGCTHFPLVRQEIHDAFMRLKHLEVDGARPWFHLIAEELVFVDPAELTAKELFRELARRKMFCRERVRPELMKDRFFISVANARCETAVIDPDGSLNRDYKYGRGPMSLETEDTVCIPMSADILPASSIRLIRTKLPQVWSRLKDPAD